MSEGSLEAPIRHPIAWQEPDFYDEAKLDDELRRVFDICHGCRRCFNLCDSFPRLFDLIDDAETGELDSVDSTDFKPIVDACTLCDMCFMVKCPYVPPHEFNLDFPHLMLRYRAIEHKKGGVPFAARQLTKTDRNGEIASKVAGLANWAGKCGNLVTRPIMESTLGIHKKSVMPPFAALPFSERTNQPEINEAAPAVGRKAVLYATCFANYNNPQIGEAAQAVLAKNGVETEVVYPRCCGMPQLEQGDIEAVAESAKATAADLVPWIEKGYDIIALVPSCALMLKFEWPLIVTDDENVNKLSAATFDVTEYIVSIAKNNGMADGLDALEGGVTVHISCHSRAQNMGQKAAEMLRLIPGLDLTVIERCSGHGGSWGIMKENFDVGIKVGKPVARKAGDAESKYILSECPLARDHIVQGIDMLGKPTDGIESIQHPIELIARAYDL